MLNDPYAPIPRPVFEVPDEPMPSLHSDLAWASWSKWAKSHQWKISITKEHVYILTYDFKKVIARA